MFELPSAYQLLISTPEEINDISDAIMHFNAKQIPFTQKETPILKNYVIKENERIIAGINAALYHWGMLFIDELFVAQTHRNKQLGSYLLKKVEIEAKILGATLAHLDTFDFQAKDFYLKHGYEIFGILDNCPPDHQRFYFKKNTVMVDLI